METPEEICKSLRLEGNPYSIQAADWIEAYVKERRIEDLESIVGIPSVRYFNSISKGMMYLIVLAGVNLFTLLMHHWMHP